MKISALCSDPRHPVVPHLGRWIAWACAQGHQAHLCHDKSEATGGDVLFLVSCTQVIKEQERSRYKHVLVLHASNLPQGRGWSPHIWSILEGAQEFTVCLLEAADPVDSGDIWLRTIVQLDGSELLPEINGKLFAAELELMTRAVQDMDHIVPQAQAGEPGRYLRKRTPADSELDPDRPLAQQFDLLRVADDARHPAFFYFRGHRYILKIEKAPDET